MGSDWLDMILVGRWPRWRGPQRRSWWGSPGTRRRACGRAVSSPRVPSSAALVRIASKLVIMHHDMSISSSYDTAYPCVPMIAHFVLRFVILIFVQFVLCNGYLHVSWEDCSCVMGSSLRVLQSWTRNGLLLEVLNHTPSVPNWNGESTSLGICLVTMYFLAWLCHGSDSEWLLKCCPCLHDNNYN
jgi:hypothetical protein